MSLARIASVLRETAGLEADALGAHHLAEAVKRLAVEADLDVPGYAELVIADASARELLIAELLVHETSFFRYPASFDHLASHARAQAAARPGPVRILSAACATGQEPCSIAIALLEAGLPPERVAIDAFDRSASAIGTARAGRFERGGTRGLGPERAARWFAQDAGGATVLPAVRALVRFERGSLLDADCPFLGISYDAVFCRNLLIYLTEASRVRALAVLRAWLAPGGLLYVGHAEVLVARAEGFAPLEAPSTYACRPEPVDLARPKAFAAPPAPRRSEPRAPSAPAPPTSPPRTAPAPAGPRAVDALTTAQGLADTGRLAEACALLDEEVARGRAGADTYHLLAVVRRASGQAREADEALGRALYLDPKHPGALLLAAVAAEGRGERTTAARLHARARAAVQGRG